MGKIKVFSLTAAKTTPEVTCSNTGKEKLCLLHSNLCGHANCKSDSPGVSPRSCPGFGKSPAPGGHRSGISFMG